MRAAEKAQKDAKVENARLLAQAQAFMAAGRLADAKRVLEDAVKNMPENDEANQALKNIDRALAAAVTTQATYQQAVQTGVLAMLAGLRRRRCRLHPGGGANPTDLDSALALKKAQIALAAQLKTLAAYNQQIKIGTNALAARAWNAAVKAFTNALTLMPNDPTASDGLTQAQYGQNMAAGKLALAQRQKANAISAFNAALTAKPGDTQATSGLRAANLLR